MYNQTIYERALTRTSKRAFRKSGLDQSFVDNCYVWFPCGSQIARVGNFVMFSGKFNRKDKRRLAAILPHVLKSLRKTAIACGFSGDFEIDDFILKTGDER